MNENYTVGKQVTAPPSQPFTSYFPSLEMLVGLGIIFAVIPFYETKFQLPNVGDSDNCFLPALLQSNPQNVHLICSASSYCPSHIIKMFPGIAWTFYDKEETVVVAQEWQDFCVFAADDYATMAQLLNRSQTCSKTKIILTFSADVSLEQMKALFTFAWHIGVVDIVLSKRVDAFCECFTYIPFHRGKCYDTTPVLLEKLPKAVLNSIVVYFPDEKISSLHSCELRVIYDVVVNNLKSGTTVIRWYRLVSFLLKAMNSQNTAIPLRNSRFTSSPKNATLIGVSLFLRTSERMQHFIFGQISKGVVTGICLQKLPVPSVQWFRIFDTYSYAVWCCIVLCFCVTVCYMYIALMGKRSLSDNIFLWYQTLLSLSVRVSILRFRDRVFLSSWLLLCMVLNAAFQSDLSSELAVRFSTDAIENVGDFLRSDITIQLPEEHFNLLATYFWATPEFLPLLKKAKKVNLDYWDLLKPVDKVAYVCGVDDLENVLLSYRMLPDSTFLIFRFYFVMPRPSALERLFLKSVLRIFDAGAFVYIHPDIQRANMKHKEREEGAVAIGMGSLSIFFMLWICGCFVAFLIFILEVVIGKKYNVTGEGQPKEYIH